LLTILEQTSHTRIHFQPVYQYFYYFQWCCDLIAHVCSGFQLTFDLCRGVGDRVSQILVRCAKCSMPKFVPLDMEAMYDVATVGYLADGGDGHTALSNNKVRHLQGQNGMLLRTYTCM
jgi:hypothetical protein